MEEKSLGKALTKKLEFPKTPLLRGGRGKLKKTMANPLRQKILMYLCSHPCAWLTKISASMKISPTTARWHLRRLVAENYIAEERVEHKTIYYPKSLLENKDEIFAAYLLNTKYAKKIFLYILENEGAPASEIAKKLDIDYQIVKWHAEKLTAKKLISYVIDGRMKRYYPGEIFINSQKELLKRSKKFSVEIISKLAEEGLQPTVERADSQTLTVKLNTKKFKSVLQFNTNPFRFF